METEERHCFAENISAVRDIAGRWYLEDTGAGLVSAELWPTAEAAATAFQEGAVSWDSPVEDCFAVATCIGCGCDDLHACSDEAVGGPCSWVRLDRVAGLGVCSACPEHVGRWDAGERDFGVPVGPAGASAGDDFLPMTRQEADALIRMFEGAASCVLSDIQRTQAAQVVLSLPIGADLPMFVAAARAHSALGDFASAVARHFCTPNSTQEAQS